MLESFKLIGGKDLKAVSWYNLKPEVQLETMSLLQHIRIMFCPLCSEGEPLNKEEKGEMSLTCGRMDRRLFNLFYLWKENAVIESVGWSWNIGKLD